MKPFKVNLLDGAGSCQLGGKPKRRGRAFYLLLLALIFSGSFGLGRLSLSETAAAALAKLDTIPIFRQMHLIASPDRRLIGESEDRVNILLLGMGGQGHDGPLLTDTILVMSVRPSDSQVAMLSIPRDLLVPLGEFGWRKINAANAYGEKAGEGKGAELARTSIEGLLGLEVPYYVRVDFSGFRQLIDDLGGIDVYVERSFTDYSYPDNNHGYQVVSFQEGWRHLDGETALQYSRSRHGNNGEGSDFARAKRQQKVLLAAKDKLLTLRLLKDPGKITDILGTMQDNIKTNLQLGEILRLAKIGRAVDPGEINHQVIDGDGPDSPLRPATINGAYVLVPRNNDWNRLRQVAANLFTEESDIELESPPSASGQGLADRSEPSPSEIRLEVLNGTLRTGLAGRTAGKLKGFGYQVVKIANASQQNHTKTKIYDLTGGQLDRSVDEIRRRLGLSEVDLEVSNASTNAADVLIILGQDAPG